MTQKQFSLESVLELVAAGAFDQAVAAMGRLDERRLGWKDRGRFVAIFVFCLRGLQDEEGAERALSDAEVGLKQEPQFALGLGEQLLDLDEYEDAVWVFERLCLSWPKLAAGWYDLGLGHEVLEEFEEGLTAFDTAISLDPDFADSYRGRAACLSGLERPTEAATAYQRYLSFEPLDEDAWIGLANAHTDGEDFDAAYTAYRHAEELEAEPRRLYLLWGLCASHRDDGARLEHCSERLHAAAPDKWETAAVDALLAATRGEERRAWEQFVSAFDRAGDEPRREPVYVAAEMLTAYAVEKQRVAEYEALLPRLFERRPFSESVLSGMRALSGRYGQQANDYVVELEGLLGDDEPEDVPDAGEDYGPPYRFIRVLRVLATSQEEARRSALDFETRCHSQGLVVHEVTKTECVGDCHLGVWMRLPAEVFSESRPDSAVEN